MVSAPASEADLRVITSPIVGTFYRAASPTSEPFVRAGSLVGPDSVVCIIEAMKLMNEILAVVTMRAEKTFVENGHPVEYGQPLFVNSGRALQGSAGRRHAHHQARTPRG